MNELTPGMAEVINAYLAPFEPAESFNADTDRLISTEIIIAEVGDGADIEMNLLADYMAGRGFHYHCIHDDGISGWILRPRQ